MQNERTKSNGGGLLSQVTKDLLRRHRFTPKKKLGQNFIIDAASLERIVSAADLKGTDAVLEIGTGLGTLTRALSERAGRVISIEYDKMLFDIACDVLKDLPNVRPIREDFLRLDLCKALGPKGSYKVVANLPYYITAPVITKLIEADPGYSLAVLTVQREVADRLTATAGSKDYGTLSIYVQYHNEVGIVSYIPRSAFLPHPAVSSAIVRMTRRKKNPVDVRDEDVFFRVVHAAFEYRRKTLRNSLFMSGKLGLPRNRIEGALRACGIEGERRGETLSMEEFAALAAALG